jgi:glycine/D-amino acid oxidase-like deaminating enzyme
MSTSYWLDRRGPRREFDVVVIGAGISGLSCAYWLEQEDPSLKVAIVEKGRIGSGATGRNAGFVTCGSVEHFNRLIGKHGKDEALKIWYYSEKNLDLLEERIIDGHAHEIEFERNGSFSLASSAAEMNELEEVAQLMRDNRIAVEDIDLEGIKSRLGVQGFVGGIKYVGDGTTHPVKMLHLIKSKIKAQIFEGEEVYGIETESDQRVVYTDGGSYSASMVVMATNGYLPALAPYFKDKVFPTKGQILVTDPVEKFMEGACYANFYLDYFRQLRTGELLIGGFRQLEKDSEVGYSDNTTEPIQKALEEFFRNHIPKFSSTKIRYRWSGVMGFSADGQPLIGSLPSDNQVFFMGGCTGHGIGLFFHGAKTLVDLIYGREIPKFLNAKRFT